jgi:branched-chain amino acid transport system substrate-binding protein
MNPLRLATLIISSLWLSACGPSEPLKIGFISGQTGAFSDLGSAGLNGALLAVEERNTNGGLNGREVKLIVRDDGHDPAKAKAAMQELLTENVSAIVGPMTSAMAGELTPIADAERIVLMGGTVVTDKLSGKDDFFLRAIAATNFYGAYSARQHHQRLKPERVTVVYDLANRDYAENWASDYEKTLLAAGTPTVSSVAFNSKKPQENIDLAKQIAASKPDLVTLACSAKSAATLIKQLHEHKPTLRFATSAWAANHLLPELAGAAAEGALVEQYHNLTDTSPRYKRFAENYQQRFKRAPDYAAVIAFDATTIVLDGLTAHTKRDGLKAALLKQKRFSGLQGPIELDAHGDAVRPAFISTIKNGNFVMLTETSGEK